MSLSLSSLLNPSPESETAPLPPRKESLPPVQYVQSPEQQYNTSPQTAYPPQHHYSYPQATEEDAAQALAALSGNSAPPPVQSQWYGSNGSMSGFDRRSDSYEQRPGSSGYNDSVQLPPPLSTARQPSSPTLDAYRVTSRSPEQRRPSTIVSPSQPTFTLPPIQGIQQPPNDYPARQLTAYEPPAKPRALTNDSHSQHEFTETTSPGQEASEKRKLSHAHPPPQVSPSNHLQKNNNNNSYFSAVTDHSSPPPDTIKQEANMTPRTSSPTEVRRADGHTSDADSHQLKTIASLKNEHGLRTHSPLRESSAPVPSTETPEPKPSASKKRPAPSKTKKGTATTATKKAPPAKRRKLDSKRSVTPSSRASKPFTLKTESSVGTPVQSSPAPSTRSQSEDAYDEPYDEDDDGDDEEVDADGDVYCICRKPDNGTFMIGCDGTCDDWFHGKCVSIEERDKNLIDKYVCPACTKAGAGRTTWKRICRRNGCRQPARVGKTKGGKDGSKYCSEDCGVLYFREMIGKSRGREDMTKHRSNRRKSSIASTDRPNIEYDLGARGGSLAAGELKSLINSSTTADDFKKLGEGVLSPPATPDSKSPKDSQLAESETQALQELRRRKEASRDKHNLLKDRLKLVNMVKQAATRTAAEKELKAKDYCGYDSRLEWTDAQFERWKNSKAGKQAFELATLAPIESNGDTTMTNNDTHNEDLADFELCDRKKCARHLEWTKLAVDDVRFQTADNGDRMRALDTEEREVRERAALRAKAGSLNGDGKVEVHGLGISMDQAKGVTETTESGTASAGGEVDATVAAA